MQSQEETSKETALEKAPERTISFNPENMNDLAEMSRWLSKSALIPEALRAKPADVLIVLMTGREMGLSAMQSLQTLNVIHGKIFAGAQLLMAQVLRSGLCEFFRCEHSDDKRATYRTRRKKWGFECAQCHTQFDVIPPNKTKCQCDGSIVPITRALTFTIEMAEAYGLLGRQGGNYKSKPGVMLRWRAAAQLARDVYPEVTLGLYLPEEAQDFVDYEDEEPSVIESPKAGVQGLKDAIKKSA